MQTKDSCVSPRRNNLEKRVAAARRIVPLMIINLVTTQKTDQMISSCGPERKLRSGREAFDNMWVDRFLKNNEIRRGRNNRLRQCLLPATTAETDVVAE